MNRTESQTHQHSLLPILDHFKERTLHFHPFIFHLRTPKLHRIPPYSITLNKVPCYSKHFRSDFVSVPFECQTLIRVATGTDLLHFIKNVENNELDRLFEVVAALKQFPFAIPVLW